MYIILYIYIYITHLSGVSSLQMSTNRSPRTPRPSVLCRVSCFGFPWGIIR